jgi:hypothetical protein
MDQHVQNLTYPFQSAQLRQGGKFMLVVQMHLFPPDCAVPLQTCPWVASGLDTDAGIPPIQL